MKNKAIVITSALLVISIGNFVQFVNHRSIRKVEFISILLIGVLLGILLVLIIKRKNL